MNSSKPWYQSKTIWGGVVTVLAIVVNVVFKRAIDEHTQTQIVDTITGIAAGVGGLVSIYGRVKAEKSIAS